MANSSDATSADAKAIGPRIRRLLIERFRGISALLWHPGPGVNVILGGGDVGKTTILEAIGLLLSPANAGTLPDTDYHARSLDSGFLIEAVMSLPHECGIDNQVKPSWPWEWNGVEPVVPSIDAEEPITNESVYRLRVRGTEDLELVYEVLQPDGSLDSFSLALRRTIGLVRLGGDDRGDRDLRLVQGSALDRLLSDRSLRSRLASALADTEVEEQLADSAKGALAGLDDAFFDQGLPGCLGLAITGGPGPSIASLIGLTADRNDVQLPLTTWGAGTRRLSALAIAAFNYHASPVTIVDEIERGLEPYRQQALIRKLQAGNSQVFLTTHSPAVIAAASTSHFWYVDHAGAIGPLEETKIAQHRGSDPAAFLARFSIVAEGKSEVGFASALLEKAIGSPLEMYGIHVSDGGGNETTLALLEALSAGRVAFGGFADNEAVHPDRWSRLLESQGSRIFRWASGCLEENIIGAVPDSSLEALIADPDNEKTGIRQRTVADRLGIHDKSFAALREAAGERFRAIIIEAARGTTPEGTPSNEKKAYKSHAQLWFKTLDGGRELAQKMFAFRLWPSFREQLLPFCNAVRRAVDLDDVEDLER